MQGNNGDDKITFGYNEEIETKEYSSMSEEEIEIWRNFLLARDGYFCTCCMKTVPELIREDAERRARQKKPERIRPVLTINHRNGDSRITAMPGTEVGSNLELTCYPCNNYKKQVQSELPQLASHDVSGSILINRSKMPKYLNHIKEHLEKFGHYCMGEALSSGCKTVGIKSSITAERHIKLEQGSNGLFDVHPFECDSPVCEGKHIFKKGQKPIDITDTEYIEMKEKERNFLDIREEENPLDPVNKVLDSYIIRQRLDFPISTEQDAFRKFDLGNHVTKYFEKLSSEAKYYHDLGHHGKALISSSRPD